MSVSFALITHDFTSMKVFIESLKAKTESKVCTLLQLASQYEVCLTLPF